MTLQCKEEEKLCGDRERELYALFGVKEGSRRTLDYHSVMEGQLTPEERKVAESALE